ncbi:MAG TPA: alpha/beta hydrolase [Chitinophagaceae bacterium]
MKNYCLHPLLWIIVLLFVGVINAKAQNKTPESLRSSGLAPVNGVNIYYEVHGDGDPIVLLHGSFMTINLNWAQLIPELSKKRKVIVLEFRGHGRSTDSKEPFSYKLLASDVAGVCKFLKIDSADVLGYSLGGTVAFQLAIQNPTLVKKLIIVSSVYKYEGWLPEMRSMLKTFKPDFLDNTPLYAEYKKVAPDSTRWHAFMEKMLVFENKPYDLGEANIKAIRSPVLLIMGDNDGVDLSHVTAMYRLLGGGVFGDIAGLPRSQLSIVQGNTHVSLMMDPSIVNSRVEAFLKPGK